MKKDLQEKNVIQPVVPSLEESEFAKTIDGQVMLMVRNAIENDSFVEAQTLSWATIEQILMPKLISWIAKVHKLNLPDDVYKSNMQSINLIYLTLSHDTELFHKLETARRKRNEIIHKITKLGNAISIKREARESTKINILLQDEIMKRFSGDISILSLNLYNNGWNDCRKETLKRLEKMKGDIKM